MNLKDLTEVSQTDFDNFVAANTLTENSYSVCGLNNTEYFDGPELKAGKSESVTSQETKYYLNL